MPRTAIIIEHTEQWTRTMLEIELAQLLKNQDVPLKVIRADEEAHNLGNSLDPECIAIWWCVDDIVDHAEQHDQKITREEAGEILGIVKRRHDCTVGVSWDVIDTHIDLFIADRKEKKK